MGDCLRLKLKIWLRPSSFVPAGRVRKVVPEMEYAMVATKFVLFPAMVLLQTSTVFAQGPARTCNDKAHVCSRECSQISARRGSRSRVFDRCNAWCEDKKAECMGVGIYSGRSGTSPE
jgi:hypothetical protein